MPGHMTHFCRAAWPPVHTHAPFCQALQTNTGPDTQTKQKWSWKAMNRSIHSLKQKTNRQHVNMPNWEMMKQHFLSFKCGKCILNWTRWTAVGSKIRLAQLNSRYLLVFKNALALIRSICLFNSVHVGMYEETQTSEDLPQSSSSTDPNGHL